MKIKNLILFFLCFLFISSSHSSSQNSKKCRFEALVFDIGSGASKSHLYEVDTCDHELNLSITDSMVVHMQYQKCISDHSRGKIPPYCMQMGIASIRDFIDYYELDCTKNICMGVATAWARNASNADSIIKNYKEYGINIDIIDQAQEGMLSFEAAMRVIDESKRYRSLVLDLGGGSHQISYYDKNGNVEIYLGAFGNSNFYRNVVENFGIDYLYASGTEGYFRADILPEIINYANAIIGNRVKEEIDTEFTSIYGLGRSIYNYMVDNLGLGPNSTTKAELLEIIYLLSDLTQDEAVAKFNLSAPSFAPYMQVSLIIMYSILDSLELEELNLLPARVTDVVLLDYLKDKKLRKSYYK